MKSIKGYGYGRFRKNKKKYNNGKLYNDFKFNVENFVYKEVTKLL